VWRGTGVNQLSLEEVVRRLASAPLLFQPGSGWRYSYSTDVLGLLIQILAKQPLEDFLQQCLFRPLRMVDTGFHVPCHKIDRLATLYQAKQPTTPSSSPPPPVGPAGMRATSGVIGDDAASCFAPSSSQPGGGPLSQHYEVMPDALAGDFSTKPTFVQSGGGLVSTAADYMRFAQVRPPRCIARCISCRNPFGRRDTTTARAIPCAAGSRRCCSTAASWMVCAFCLARSWST
jgi:CubicO group peptidase (beta-lactamase class C family)